MNFYEIHSRKVKANLYEVYPDYQVDEDLENLMVRGGAFYAVWDADKNIWNRNERAVKRIVDRDVMLEKMKKQKSLNATGENMEVIEKCLKNNSSGKWAEFKTYLRNINDSYKRLDENVSFIGNDTKDKKEYVNYKGRPMEKEDLVSKRVPYKLIDGPCPAWDKMISTLYEPDERDKIEWAIGSIIAGDAKRIQKFIVFYGPQGSGKSTVMNIVMKLFEGYYTTFKAENLIKGSDNFNLDFLADDPLVAIDADTDLSHIESNTLINQIVSHEQLKVNEKFKNRYPNKPICMLMLGTNQPVRITDAKSGIIRRLIDIEPSGRLIKPESKYDELNDQIIGTELGSIAKHCLNVYKELGRTYYNDYIPEKMMYRTNAMFNFMQDKIYYYMKEQAKEREAGRTTENGISASKLWTMWQDYCLEADIKSTKKRFEIIDEAQNYFDEFTKDLKRSDDGSRRRSWFSGFKFSKFEMTADELNGNKKTRRELKMKEPASGSAKVKEKEFWLKLKEQKSLLDQLLSEYPAQYDYGNPKQPLLYKWENCKTKLKDLDTTKTHFVKGPGTLIFADFDAKKDGKKDLETNLKLVEKGKWEPTYAETSNSGSGLHLYYWYDGDVNDLSSVFDTDVEIKVFPDDQNRSMRRRVFLCNDLPIAHISSGLPFKEKKVINWDGVKDDKHLRNMVLQALKKECRPYGEEPKTVTCVKWIRDILKNAQDQGMTYDIRDLGEAIYAFAAHSRNNKDECINMFYDMELMWPKETKAVGNIIDGKFENDAPIIILDCEVVRNLLLIVYKELGPDKKCVRMYNPKPIDIERLFDMRIVGHNVTGYDNFILWATWLGYSNEEIFQLSQDIIVHGNRLPWREAKNVSYTDTLDVSSEKKGLKKIEIEMHFPHKEMEIDWSKPLPESEWERLAQYCENDVLATEAYFLSKKWQADFKARKILASLTGMTVNDSTNNLVAQLIFGDVREPWHEFVYPDLKAKFPDYRFENGKSYYGDEVVGEGGRVYAEPGMYYDVMTFDVASMHPTSIIVENGFGPYTQVYEDLYKARIAIKHKDYEAAKKMFGGRLAPYLENDEDADDLSYALKIALNSTYGMTAAHFQNRFKDPRNVDNWVAKRGALFMEKLRREVQKQGGHVVHIKTDSIKLVNPSEKLQNFVLDFGKQYGYTFEIESRYERICLVNHAVYIAYRAANDPGWLKECAKAQKKAEASGEPYIEPTRWTATGAQFAHPFVFKRLFSKEPLEFWDFCETKTVKTALYLDMNEKLPDVKDYEKDKEKVRKRIKALEKQIIELDVGAEDRKKISNEIESLQKDILVLDGMIAEGHNYVFVGKAGEFMPVKDGYGGGLLMRKETDGDFGYATGAKGYRWLESENLHSVENWKEYIDIRYFKMLTDTAIDTISKYGDFEFFVRDTDGVILPEDRITDINDDPWQHPCGNDKYAYCSDCPDFDNEESGRPFCKKGYDITKQILGE